MFGYQAVYKSIFFARKVYIPIRNAKISHGELSKMKKNILTFIPAALLTIGLLTGCESGVRSEEVYFQLRGKNQCISVSRRDLINQTDDYKISVVNEKEKEILAILSADLQPKIKIVNQEVTYKFNDQRIETQLRGEKIVLSRDLEVGTLEVYKRDIAACPDEYRIVVKDKKSNQLLDEKTDLLTVIASMSLVDLSFVDKEGKTYDLKSLLGYE